MIKDVPDPKFEDARSYLVTGKILNTICSAIIGRTPIAGRGVTLHEVAKGVEIHASISGVSDPRPFQITAGVPQSIITISTIAGAPPAGFAGGIMKITLGSGGYVLAKVTINKLSGDIASREIVVLSTYPDNTDSVFYQGIGYFWTDDSGWHVTNMAYGPVNATVCRNWFAPQSPYFGVTMSAS